MIAAWMLYSVVVAVVVAAACALLERTIGAWTAATRLVWLCGLCLTLALTASVLRPAGGGLDPGTTVVVRTTSGLPPFALVPNSSRVEPGQRGDGRVDRALLLSWALMSGFAVTMLVGSAIRLARRRRQWVRGRIDGLSVRIADDVGPAVLGVLRNEIVVPRWLLSHSASDRQLILEHERQHVLARDPLVLFSALLLASLLPWNPGVWLLVRGLRRSTEIDCDRRVLRTCGRPGRYASLLIEIGSRARSPMLARMGLVGRESDLERRVSAILGLSQGTSRRPTGSRLVLSGALLATPLLAPHPVVRLPSFAAGHALDGATDRPLPEGAGVASGSSLLAARAGSLRRSVLAGGTNTRVARGGAGMSWTGPSGESHVIDSDTLAHLMAQHYPGLVNELAHPDSIVVVFAFDDEARLMHTTVAPAPPDGRDVRAVLHRLFPDLAGRRWRGGGWISRLVTSAPGARPRRVATVFGVFEADP